MFGTAHEGLLLAMCTWYLCVPSRMVHATLASMTQKGNSILGQNEEDNEGYSVALSADGLTLATGAYHNDDGGNNAGMVRVYQWVSNAWQQKGSDITGSAAGGLDGSSVALSSDGSIVAVTGSGYNGNQGQTRVFQWSGSAWSQKGSTFEGNSNAGLNVGLSSDGTVVAMGDKGAGEIYVKSWQNSNWALKGSPINPANPLSDQCATTLAMDSSGNYVAFGCPKSNSQAGSVKVFVWESNAWAQKGDDIEGKTAGDQAGGQNSVSIAANANEIMVAVGSPFNDEGGSNSGQVRVFAWRTWTTPPSWGMTGGEIDGTEANAQFGAFTALSSDLQILAVGSQRATVSGNSFVGFVRLYRNIGIWQPRWTDFSGAMTNAYAGPVALSSDALIVAVGEPSKSGALSEKGQVRVWEQLQPTTTMTATSTTATTTFTETVTKTSTTTSSTTSTTVSTTTLSTTTSTTVTAAVVPGSGGSGRVGYSHCYTGKACWFTPYLKDTHYMIYKSTAGYSQNDCATACTAEPKCEAFESLSNDLVPSCVFWMNGACNIPAGNPDGYVATNVAFAYTCEKAGARSTYMASQSLNSCILSRSLKMLSIFFMADVVG